MTRASVIAVIRIYGEELRRLARESYGTVVDHARPAALAWRCACELRGVALEEVVVAIESDRSLGS